MADLAMLMGDASVSTGDQNLNLPHDVLKAMGCERLFADTVSGARTERPGLTAALSECRTGDSRVVWKLGRLGRSLSEHVWKEP